MKARLFVTVLFLPTLASPLLCQDTTAMVDQSTRDEVVRFMQLLQVRSQMITTMTAMEEQQKKLAESSFKQTNPNATPLQIQQLDRTIDVVMKEMSSDQLVDEMIDAIVPIYQRHFSKSDLDGILAFYTSPVGQKLQSENPAIARESMQAVGQIVAAKLPELRQKLDAQIQQMVTEDKKASASDPSSANK